VKNKVLLVTGASRGIGASTAILAAEKGYQVCVNYRSNELAANNLVEKIRQTGGTAYAIQADVSDEQQVVTLFKQLDEKMGTISALVNNAGILETQTSLEHITAARLLRVFQTNVFGSFLCAREAIRRMSTQHGGSGGSIVNVSSGASRLGSPNEYVDYAASKGAIDTMTIGLSREVADQGIRVNSVRPGFIYTQMHADGGEPGRVDRVKAMVPMKRGGQPEEVAQAILWLLSDAASYTTGSFIDITGGK
jgi:NAD(P)-dependent dehydrogenase (short-subunit alcohol dehydrogenase family)